MKNIYKKLLHINKNKKQIGEMVLIVGAIYTYFLYNNITKGMEAWTKDVN